MGIIKTLKQQGSELSKYDGKTPRDNKPEKLNRILRFQGSELSRYDGRTPPDAVFPDPLDSSNSYLSAYKGLTPQPSLLTTNQSPLLYPYSITGEARDQVQFEYGLYSNGATAVLPLPTLLGVNIFDTPLSYYYDGTDGYYGKTVGVGTNPSRQTLSDGTLENRLTIAYTAKIANQKLGTANDPNGGLAINPFGIDDTTPPNILLQYNSPVSSPEEPSLEFVRIQNPTIRLKDLYDDGEAQAKAIFDNPNQVSPLAGQKFNSHKEPEWIYNPNLQGISNQILNLIDDGDITDVNPFSYGASSVSAVRSRNDITIYNKPFDNPKAIINYISDDPSKPGYLTPNIVSPANIEWIYNPIKSWIEEPADGSSPATSALLNYARLAENTTEIISDAYGGGPSGFANTFLKSNQNDTNIQIFEESGFQPATFPSTGLSNLNPYYTLRINISNQITTGNPNEIAAGIENQSAPLPIPYPNIKNFNRVTTYETADSIFRKARTRLTNESITFDGVNSLPIQKGSANKGTRNHYDPPDVATTPLQDYKNKDLVKFFFEINNNDAETNTANWFLFFRAYINNLGDNFNSNWQEYKYIGRGENFYKYNGFSREISLDFTIYAHSRDEMIPLYEKLNLLVSSLAPDYSKMGYMRGNFVNLTVGDYMNNLPGIIKSIQLKPSLEAGWDINRYTTETQFRDGEFVIYGEPFKVGRLINPNQTSFDLSNYFVGQLPRQIDVTMTFTPIHSFTPKFNSVFIGNKDLTLPTQESFTQEEIDRLNKAAEGDTSDIIGPPPSPEDI